MRHDVAGVEPELDEITEWVDWMERELMEGGIDLPSSEVCFGFASRGILLAHQLKEYLPDLTMPVRRRVIRASVVYQCWKRHRELSKKSRLLQQRELALPVLEARDLQPSDGGRHKVITASDGHEYATRFPSADKQCALASEVICFAIARELGLNIPPLAVVVVDRRRAAQCGIRFRDSRCPTKDGPNREALSCFGVRRLTSLRAHNGRPTRPLSTRARVLLHGELLLEILLSSIGSAEPIFIAPTSFAEPVFSDYTGCLLGANWPEFLKEDLTPPFVDSSVARRVHSFQQLETWIAKIERIDLEHICQMLIQLPADWYGNKPLMLAKVLQVLALRTERLRHTVLHLVDLGYFPNIQHPVASSEPEPIRIARKLAMANVG